MNRTIVVVGILSLIAGCSGRGAATARPDGTPDRARDSEQGAPDGLDIELPSVFVGPISDAPVTLQLPTAEEDGTFPPPAEAPPSDRPYAVELAAGLFHTCARMSDGTVRCWGMGEDGQLGDGAKTNRNAPVAVTGLERVVQLVAEGSRTCAVRDDGTVWCWGPWATVDAVEAQLAADASAPLDLVRATPERDGNWENVRRLAIGSGNDCAVDKEGRVLCRGSNTRGGAGDGTAERRLVPAVVPGVKAVDVAVQMDSTCALTEDGRVLCWGWNDYCGQLGDGTKQDRLVPGEVPGLAGVTTLAAGSTYACAVLGDGTMKCWGCNESGQLGDGTTDERTTPSAVPGLVGVRRVDASAAQTCVTLADGTARCWGGDTPAPAALWTACPTPKTYRMEGPGENGSYRIGPEETYCPTPAPLPGVTGVLQAVPASLHACVLLRDGTVRCWGSNFYGGVGDGRGGGLGEDRSVPTPVELGR